MTHLPTHPYTGLTALGLRRDGRPIWPVLGGSEPPVDPPAPAAPPVDQPPAPSAPAADDKPLGPAGERALASEREARKALEKQLADLAPLKRVAEALSGKTETGKSEVELLNERFAQHEADLAAERSARWRAEVAHEKGLTPQQAARLQGATREELLADADALLSIFPAAPAASAKPAAPAPDPVAGFQGHRAGGTTHITRTGRQRRAQEGVTGGPQ